MGAICGKVETQGESRKEVEEDLRIDNRKRNSLIFAVIEWVSAVDAHNSVKDSEKLATIIARRPRDTETATDDPRASRQTKESEAIAGGNFRALRGILISEWRFVNRKYPNLNDDTLLHIACREGYLRMVQFITDKKNQPQFENVELDVNMENGKWQGSGVSYFNSAAVSLHSNDSSPREKALGGLWCEFEAVRTAQADAAARRVHAARRDVLCATLWCG
jgi:hypothetical protein